MEFITFTRELLEDEHTQVLRALGRAVGVKAPTSKSKDAIVEEILAIQSGELKPVEPSTKGAPVKMDSVDLSKFYVKRSEDLPYDQGQSESDCTTFQFSDSAKDQFIVEGLLDVQTNASYGFLRVTSARNVCSDVYVPDRIIKKYNLRKGDFVNGSAKVINPNESPALQNVIYINNCSPEEMVDRPLFEDFTACSPNQKFNLDDGKDISLRCVDLFVPIGKGQRGLIVAPPKTGKTTLLVKLANAISTQNKGVKVLMLLVDERPEEVSDIRRSLVGEVIASPFDESYEHHVRVAELCLSRGKRLAESGEDVVILLDSITRLARAYNNVVTPSGRTLSGGMDPIALQLPKRFFGSARKIECGGSLTIIATALIGTESRMDDVIFEEFKGTGNMEIYLSRELAEKRVFPAIDVFKSGTRKEEKLLSADELATANKVRRSLSSSPNATEKLLDMLSKTKTKAEFIAKINS